MMTVWTYSVQCTYRTKAGPHIFLHDVCVALNFARAFMRKMARGIGTEIKMMATGDRRQIHDTKNNNCKLDFLFGNKQRTEQWQLLNRLI